MMIANANAAIMPKNILSLCVIAAAVAVCSAPVFSGWLIVPPGFADAVAALVSAVGLADIPTDGVEVMVGVIVANGLMVTKMLLSI